VLQKPFSRDGLVREIGDAFEDDDCARPVLETTRS